MLQMFVLALSLYNTWNRGVFLLCKITNLLIYSYEYRIRKISDNGSLPSVEFLLLMIYKHLLILGIDMQPGFKSEQIQEKIRETLPEIPDGLYLRVNDLMEKYFYGGEPLEEYEIRLVHQFLLKLRDSRKKMGIFDRLRFRYCIFS